MRYSPSDKPEIIRVVEQSPLPTRRTLEKLGIPRSSFYRWYDRYQRSGPEALADRPSRPDRVWNRIPEAIRSQIVDLALVQPELSPRELAVRFTDEAEYFVSEASVYRLLKAHDLITSPTYIVIKAVEAFKDKTTAPNQLWQTDFTYLKITGWGWYYLSTVLDDFSRFIVAWKLCATMKANDVTATLDLALAASGLDQMTVVHRPRLLSDNGASYVAADLAQWLDRQEIEHVRSAPSRTIRRSLGRTAVGSSCQAGISARPSVGPGPLRSPRPRRRMGLHRADQLVRAPPRTSSCSSTGLSA
jgi:putative transposase